MVVHQPEQNRFILEQGEQTCLLEYSLSGESIDFTHTYVPFRLRGKGMAEQLVEAGLSWAQSQGYQIHASCWYVDKFLTASR